MPDAASAVPQPALPVQPKSTKSERRRTVAPEETAQIVELFKQGISIKDIGAQLNIHGQVVNGLIQSARRRGLLPSAGMRFTEMQKALLPPLPEQAPPGAVPVHSIPVEQVSPPMNGNYQQPAPASATPMVDDFSGGRPVVGASGGFTGSTQTVRYTVERIAPPDGLLGTHYGSFSVEELGQNYGEGHYKVTKHDPANPKFAFEYFQKIGKSYGASRSPNHAGTHGATPNRPFFQRNWGTQNPEEEQHPERPVYRPYQRPDSERMLSEFARQSHHANSAGLDKAIEVMGVMHQQSIAQIEAARKGGPDSMITSFFREQQELGNRRLEEERTREERRRKDEEDKWQRRQEEEQRRWERDQTAERDRHQRELERIARETEAREKALRLDAEEREKRATEERRFLLDLEEKKINLVRQEGESAQKRLEAELAKSREEMKEMSERTNKTLTENQEATTRHIEESQKQIQEQLDREREQLEREHKLKEKALDVRREYDTKMYELQKENMVNSGGDQIFNTINTVIKEVSKGLEKVVDLKKLETLSPEAQAAAVARGTIQGPNVGETYPHRQQAVPAAQAIPEPQQAEQAGGQTAPAPEQPAAQEPSPGQAVVENRMESLINENLKKPFFQEVLKEWALHVSTNTDPSIFANFYLEMMRDERNGEGRQACAAFATFMQPRNWKLMYKVLEKACDEETKAIFQSEHAAGFYESFRAMVTEQIRDYWEQFVQSRIQKNAAVSAAPNGTPTPQAPVEPAGTQAKSAAPSGQSP